MVYTQVIESPLFLKLPHPNPPRCFGEGTQYCSVKTKKQKYVGWVEERNPTFSMIFWFYTIGCLRGNFR